MLFQGEKSEIPRIIVGDVLLTLFLKPACGSFGKNVFYTDIQSSLEELQEDFVEFKV